MIIKKIKLKNFRNYNKLELFFNSNINIIYGDNAQGKTNLLESIYFLAMTKSHRLFLNQNLIKMNQISAKVQGIINQDDIDTKYEIILNEKVKTLKIDNNIVKKNGDYISKINVIIFYPEDLDLIKSSPNIRREYLNTEISQLYNGYYEVLNDFNKLLKMKNDYLKNKDFIRIDDNYLDILNSYFIDKSILIFKMRKKFIDKINENCEDIYLKITNKNNFSIKYISSIKFDSYEKSDMKQKMQFELQKILNSEIFQRRTLIGPHRDDFEFYLDNLDLKKYGSQGQQRVSVLTLKLSEIEIFKKYKNDTPILLLDDIFSELDDNKKNNLLNYIDNKMQVIITTTDLNSVNEKILSKSKLIKISNGNIES